MPPQQFTGQRLDSTGLYYYGARYYDPAIGRFISPDTTIPDGCNTQSINRYSYVINNPTSAIDPTGLDYIFVGGHNSKVTDAWWNIMLTKLNVDVTKEKVLFIPDPTPGDRCFEAGDQAGDLEFALATGDYKDIKIIGHSEGAAATAIVLDRMANDSSYLANTNVRDELTAAFLLDAPTGISDFFVGGPSINSAYNNLPAEVHANTSMGNVILADIWNTASIVHSLGDMPGWERNSHSYDSRSWWEQTLSYFSPELLPGYSYFDLLNTGRYHSDPLTSDYTIDVIHYLLGY